MKTGSGLALIGAGAILAFANTRVRAGLPAGAGEPVPENVPGETEVTEDIYEE